MASLADGVWLEPKFLQQDAMDYLNGLYQNIRAKGAAVYVSYACVNIDAVPEEQKQNVEKMDSLFRGFLSEMEGVRLVSRLCVSQRGLLRYQLPPSVRCGLEQYEPLDGRPVWPVGAGWTLHTVRSRQLYIVKIAKLRVLNLAILLSNYQMCRFYDQFCKNLLLKMGLC